MMPTHLTHLQGGKKTQKKTRKEKGDCAWGERNRVSGRGFSVISQKLNKDVMTWNKSKTVFPGVTGKELYFSAMDSSAVKQLAYVDGELLPHLSNSEGESLEVQTTRKWSWLRIKDKEKPWYWAGTTRKNNLRDFNKQKEICSIWYHGQRPIPQIACKLLFWQF